MTEDDYLPPPPSTTPVTLSRSTAAGLAALLIGCSLLISACAMMSFNTVLFRGGLRGIPVGLSIFAAALGVGSVAVMGMVGIVLGLRGWSGRQSGESRALGIGGTAAGIGGLIAWLIAGINLLIILLSW